MSSRRWGAPSTFAGSALGTSSGGNSNARLPGDGEFIEERSVKRAPYAGNLEQFRERELRFRKILFRHFAQAFLTKQRQVHRCCQRAKRLVCANIGSGFLAANVLLACRKRQHKSAMSRKVRGLPRQPSRHLTNVSFTRGNHAGKRSAITRRQAKALRFKRHDVRLYRPPAHP